MGNYYVISVSTPDTSTSPETRDLKTVSSQDTVPFPSASPTDSLMLLPGGRGGAAVSTQLWRCDAKSHSQVGVVPQLPWKHCSR